MTIEPETDTADYSPATGACDAVPTMEPPLAVRAEIAAITDRGKVRDKNEDNYLVVRYGRYLRTMLTSLPEDLLYPEHELGGFGMAVADGMGGMAAGEVASRLALTVLVELVLETPDWIFSQEQPHIEEVIARAIRRFDQINRSVLEEAQRNPRLHGMGTTLTMACSLGEELLIAHVGDSPAYLLRRGKLQRLTRDHTVAQEIAQHGGIPIRDVPARYRHALTQAIGVRPDGAGPDILRVGLEDGDRLLLCTDGLTDMLDDPTIAERLAAGETSEASCRALVEKALERGGRDNVTVVVATYRFGDDDSSVTGTGA